MNRRQSPHRSVLLAGPVLGLLVCLSSLAPRPGSAAVGETDIHGYSWHDDDDGCSLVIEPFGAGAGTALAATAVVGPIPLGFNMPFYDQVVSQVWISPEGYVTFSNPGVGGPQQSFPDPAGPNFIIAAHWTAVTNADLTWQSTGGDTFQIHWDQHGTAEHDVDLWLHRDGSFRMSWFSTAYVNRVIGFENRDGSAGRTLFRLDASGERAEPGFPNFLVGNSACITKQPTLLDCSNAIPIGCNETLASSLPGPDPDPANVYPCVAGELQASERIFRLDIAVATRVTVELSDPSLELMRIDDAPCNEHTCLERAAPGTGRLDYALLQPGSYHFVVDAAAAGATNAFSITTTCIDPSITQLDCSAPIAASCALTYSGDTSGASNGATFYACSGDAFNGKEHLYRFYNPVEQAVAVRLLLSQPGQQLFILDGCSENECLFLGDMTVSCALLPQGEYFLVVDSPAGSEGPYEFEVSCSQFFAGLDLRLSNIESRLTGSCTDLDASGDVIVQVSNLGTVPALAPFDVVVFEDNPSAVNGLYDPPGSPVPDQLLGQVTVTMDMAPGETRPIVVPSVGVLQFRDNVIYALVDPDAVVVGDVDRSNNIFDTGRGCEFRPPVGRFTPAVEWFWQGGGDPVGFRSVDTVPLVGDVDGDGIPNVVINTGQLTGGFGAGVVRMLDGRDGSEIWVSNAPATRTVASSNLAMGELDGLPGLEIVAQSRVNTSTLIALDSLGNLLWTSAPLVDQPAAAQGGGAISIADIDCDGRPEVIYGKNVFNGQDGSLFWTPEPGARNGINSGGDASLSVVADVDLDGQLEVVAGSTCYKWNPLTGMGEILWNNISVPDGWAAVGNFDGDDYPEIALTANGMVYLLEGDTGVMIWQQFIPRGGGGCSPTGVTGGPPTVADFDGDCRAEVGVAGADLYTVLETDGSVLWSSPINDCSSHRTASSVFDFDGDGAAEVAFMDQTRLHIFRGTDGVEITSLPTSSHTWIEMISIADVDADNNAEIIMPLNGAMNGVQSIGDLDDNWVNTRRIWNQHAYHINNVNDDGSIPPAGSGTCENASWLLHGTYRDQIGVGVFSAPDITISIIETELVAGIGCIPDLRIVARVGNGGALGVGQDFNASFYIDDPLEPSGYRLELNTLIPDLGPGEFGDFEIIIRQPAAGMRTILALADDDGTFTMTGSVNECREDNNECSKVIQNSGGGDDEPPEPIGWALRATAHGDPYAAQITAEFNWFLDDGAPRPAEDSFRVYRGRDPQALALVSPDGHAVPTWSDSTARAVTVPLVRFYKIFAVDGCDNESLD